MVRPFPIETARRLDPLVFDLKAGALSSLFSSYYMSSELRSIAEGRRQKAELEAEELGLEVYEYVFPEDWAGTRSGAPRFHGFALAASESHLDGLVTVFEVMSS